MFPCLIFFLNCIELLLLFKCLLILWCVSLLHTLVHGIYPSVETTDEEVNEFVSMMAIIDNFPL